MWILILALTCYVHHTVAAGPTVVTAQGPVRGSLCDDQYYSFLGIPFATVDPQNPFGDSLPGPKFKDIFIANNDKARCPQEDHRSHTEVGSLDCLHLNVFVPKSASSNNTLPVMVWIYGGGFVEGAFGQLMFGPQYIIKHDVILVTLNYRVGPYGFMCLDIPSVPGNTGLKDQQAGLRWVKENIAAFGGDTNSVTVFGQSVGAMSLEFHILSPGSTGLFDRAIMQSGSALVEGLVVPSKPSAPLEIVKHLGLSADSVEEALEIIKAVPTNDVIKASSDLELEFKPCIEKSFKGVNNFMVDYPDITLRSRQYESVPMIIGFNSHEQLGRYVRYMNNDTFFYAIKDIFYKRINASFSFKREKQLKSAAGIFQQFYIGSKTVSKDVLLKLSAFDSDAHMNYPIERSVKYYLEKSNMPFYQYVFAYSGGLNEMRTHMKEAGAWHGDDTRYLFKGANAPTEISSQDKLMIDRMTTMWTNFAKHSDPTPETSELLPVRWPPVTRDSRDYLYIDNELAVNQKPLHSRIAFWDLFFLAFGDYYRMVWEAFNF